MDSAGEVAEGEIITTPFGTATFCKDAIASPEHIPPTMPLTPSAVIRRSTVAVAAAASVQVESPWTGITVDPSRSRPESLTSFMASSAPDRIPGAMDSSGPVKPSDMPSLISSADAAPASNAPAAVARRSFFITLSPSWNNVLTGTLEAPCPKEKHDIVNKA